MKKSIHKQLKINDVTFWMEMDGERVEFEVYDFSGIENFRFNAENHPVKDEFVIHPVISNEVEFHKLEFKTDRLGDDYEYIDQADNDFCDGGIFNVNGMLYGLAIYDLFHFDHYFSNSNRVAPEVNAKRFKAVYSDIKLKKNNWLFFQVSCELKSDYDEQVRRRGKDTAIAASFDAMRDLHDHFKWANPNVYPNDAFSKAYKRGKDVHIGPIKFWIEKDGKKIDTQLIDVTKEGKWYLKNHNFFKYPLDIEHTWFMKPVLPKKYSFDDLVLHSHYDQKKIIPKEVFSDEFYECKTFDAGQFTLGLAIQGVDETMETWSDHGKRCTVHYGIYGENMQAGYDSMNQDNYDDLMFQFIVKEKSYDPFYDDLCYDIDRNEDDAIDVAADMMYSYTHPKFWDYPKS
ncbi:hypothetical protein [Fructobacillus papyrifericola]|uniref:Uncharacterized protein n=1 Tax=Fructobacillus papyrifericola TaxID=2713172 RepID=A0ABS5QRJ4_9LACO|nr:hypothetical protein [Fructobacillus papyrifericola]MBS9335808.1 hypothetical protein [Fructobacillus papyrifericola]